jgi:hypothetical protein
MAERLHIVADAQVTSTSGTASGVAAIDVPLDETVPILYKTTSVYELLVDTPVPVAFGGVTNAHVVVLKAVGGKVKATCSTADGAAQVVPVDSILFWEPGLNAPVTSMTLTRLPGTDTFVHVFLAQIQ